MLVNGKEDLTWKLFSELKINLINASFSMDEAHFYQLCAIPKCNFRCFHHRFHHTPAQKLFNCLPHYFLISYYI